MRMGEPHIRGRGLMFERSTKVDKVEIVTVRYIVKSNLQKTINQSAFILYFLKICCISLES